MATLQPPPRLEQIDAEWAHRLLVAFNRERAEILEDASQRQLSQLDYVILAESCKDVGMLSYGLGYPLGETRVALVEAAKAWLWVFELRGEPPAFDVTVIGEGTAEPLREQGASDLSLTNSRRGLQAIYLALAACTTLRLARQVAALVWDPEDASYIGPESEVCTPDDQQLAYAVKALLLENETEALSQLHRRSPDSSSASSEAALIEALITGQKAAFLLQLKGSLDQRRAQLADTANHKNIDLYFDVRGLALCKLAIHSGLAQPSELPDADVLLPLGLADSDSP